MANNPAFANPTPTLSQLQVILAAFTTTRSLAKNGGTAATAAKNAARETLVAALRSLGQYLGNTAAGDLAALLSSKYPLQKSHARVGIQDALANLRLKYGKISGSVTALGTGP